MLPLGTAAPPFSLHDVVHGQTYSLDSFADKTALLVMFICRHCPYVVYVEVELAGLGRDYRDTSVGIIAISSSNRPHGVAVSRGWLWSCLAAVSSTAQAP